MSGSERMNAASPHPLARQLVDRLRARRGARVVAIGTGSGRSAAALTQAGFDVTPVDDAAAYDRLEVARFAAALSTHALLHGTTASLERALASIARALEPDAPFFSTFASTRDARFGRGRCVEPYVFAAESGDEAGVAHAYFDRERLENLLKPHFVVESLDECDVDDVVGTWSHGRPAGSVHWFAKVRAKATGSVPR